KLTVVVPARKCLAFGMPRVFRNWHLRLLLTEWRSLCPITLLQIDPKLALDYAPKTRLET
ncbi:MAG: hypothetical protein QGF59_18960, partial [Pirellulaceae bacterium]|nr:hypothetical protein [Pirellulaceae bacterium]